MSFPVFKLQHTSPVGTQPSPLSQLSPASCVRRAAHAHLERNAESGDGLRDAPARLRLERQLGEVRLREDLAPVARAAAVAREPQLLQCVARALYSLEPLFADGYSSRALAGNDRMVGRALMPFVRVRAVRDLQQACRSSASACEAAGRICVSNKAKSNKRRAHKING